MKGIVMKIVAINSLPYGSTGNIMLGILHKAEETLDADVKAYYGAWKNVPDSNDLICIKFGNKYENLISALLSRITGYHNVWSYFGTKKLIGDIKKNDPDIIHLHNLHLWNINLPILFQFIKKNHISVVWTLHDCWPFTGQCPHFTLAQCNKWKNGCGNCGHLHEYPAAYVDKTRQMWKLKKKWFTGIKDLIVVTPSMWLADLVNDSFLREYPRKVIHNGIDLSIFKPTVSQFKFKYDIEEKYIILGVSFGWGMKKGLDVFIQLAERLDNIFQIVLVGTDSEVDRQLPLNIISIHRTHNQEELAKIYSAADILVNPTREDNYPTVNMESIACGTPVITFNTGGSPETFDCNCGCVVDCNDIDALLRQIHFTYKFKPYSKEACLEYAKEHYDKNQCFGEYIELFKNRNLQS